MGLVNRVSPIEYHRLARFETWLRLLYEVHLVEISLHNWVDTVFQICPDSETNPRYEVLDLLQNTKHSILCHMKFNFVDLLVVVLVEREFRNSEDCKSYLDYD